MKYIKFVVKFINSVMNIVYFIKSLIIIIASALTIYHRITNKEIKLVQVKNIDN